MADDRPPESAAPNAARVREHLFINYATENGALAEWLTLKLTALGYRVWCDKIKLLGGESYPQDIDLAIQEQTFRFIALLSRDSLRKPNPLKERTAALNVARERKQPDFVIPLNLDGLAPTELGWQMSDVTFIPFAKWDTGLALLLKKLESIGAPRPLMDSGASIAASAAAPPGVLVETPDTLTSNVYRFERIPEVLRHFRLTRALAPGARVQLFRDTGCWTIGSTDILAFSLSNTFLLDHQPQVVEEVKWREVDTIAGLRIAHVLPKILSRALEARCLQRGLVFDAATRALYFPSNSLPKDRLPFVDKLGRGRAVRVAGFQHKQGERFRYHLAPRFRVIDWSGMGYAAIITVGLRVTDAFGHSLADRSRFSRQRQVRTSWRNHQLRSRTLAIRQFLEPKEGAAAETFEFDDRIVLAADPISWVVPLSIDEALLSEATVRSKRPEDDELEEVHA